jgi:hydroxyethylthiazole kinase-like uncharacterized protein yjeF
MVRLVTREQQRWLDQAYSEATGLPSIVLMEQAAAGLSCQLIERLTWNDRDDATVDVVYLAGPGMNGGDAWASARQLLARGHRVLVFDACAHQPADGDRATNMHAYYAMGGESVDQTEALVGQVPKIIVDALFGTGFRPDRALPDWATSAFMYLRHWKGDAMIVACDIPSGVDANTGQSIDRAVEADVTVTFGRPKIGLVTHPGALKAGRVEVAPIGMSDAFVERVLAKDARGVFTVDETTYPLLLPRHARDGHKGQFGRALLIGGAEGMAGALVLAARASERVGVGYTMVRAPKASLPVIASAIPSALMSAVPETGDATKHDLPAPTAVAVGIGAGDAPWVVKALTRLLGQSTPVIIDADGLNALAKMPNAEKLLKKTRRRGPCPGGVDAASGRVQALGARFGRSLGRRSRGSGQGVGRSHARHRRVERHGDRGRRARGAVTLNMSGNVGLAKGGSGDVLTGMIVGLAAQSGRSRGRRASRRLPARIRRRHRRRADVVGSGRHARGCFECRRRSEFAAIIQPSERS